MDRKMTDRVLAAFGHNVFNLLPEIVFIYMVSEKIYVSEIWKKIYISLRPFFPSK